MGAKPRALNELSDRDVERLCERVKVDWERRKYNFATRESVFAQAAESLELKTRYALKDAARAEGKRTSRIWQGALSPAAVRLMEAILAFGDEPFDQRVLGSYLRMTGVKVRAALARLREAGLVDPDSYAVRWVRFGLDRFDAELAVRITGLDVEHDSPFRLTYECLMVLLQTAAAGQTEHSIENLALLTGLRDWAVEDALQWLRWAGMVRTDTIQVDLAGIERFEKRLPPP